jgi:hypothetical protein
MAQAAPDTRGVATGLGIVEQSIRVFAVIFGLAIEFVSADVNDFAIAQDSLTGSILFEVFIEDAGDERDGFRVGSIQHFAAAFFVVAHLALIDEVRADASEGESVARRVEFSHDVYAVLLSELNEVGEFLLRVREVLSGERGAIGALDLRFQAEGRVTFLSRIHACIEVVFVEDEVIVNDQVEVIHLKPGHRADDVLKVTHGVGSTSDIEQEATHRVAREVDGQAARESVRVLAEELEESSGAPDEARGGSGSQLDAMRGDGHFVAFIAQVIFEVSFILYREDGDISLFALGSRDDFAADDTFQFREEDSGQFLIGAGNGDLEAQFVLTFVPSPLEQFRDNIRLRVALLRLSLENDFIVLRDGFLTILGDFKAHIDGGISDDRRDFPGFIDDLFIVSAQDFDFSAIGFRKRERFGARFKGGGDVQVISDLLSILAE